MSWLRLDDKFARHPKVIGLSDRAYRVHMNTMLYCAEFETRGFVPPSAFSYLAATAKVRRELVAASLWDDREDEGLWVHDFLVFNGETVAERVAAYLAEHPDATANHVLRAVGGKRELVLEEVRKQRPFAGSPNGSPAGTPSVPDFELNGSLGNQSGGSRGGTRARAPVPSLNTSPPTPSSPRPKLAPGEAPAQRTSCPVCDCHLDQRVRDAAFIYDQELTRRVYEHLVNVHRWEEDRALDIAVKTAGTPWAPPPDDGINPFLDEKEPAT